MSAKVRMQFLGNVQVILVVAFVSAAGWLLYRWWGGLFNLLLFLGTVFWASQYLFGMYELDSRLDAFSALLTFMFGINLPHMIISEGRILKKSNGTFSRLGGPGVLVVKSDSAVVTELNTRPRVLGPGIHLITHRHEAIKEVVDLRPQLRDGTVKAMTKDGFEIEVFFMTGFQIQPSGGEPTPEEPWPFSEQAVLDAVYKSKQVTREGAQLWYERVPGALYGNVREMIATRKLEDFFEPDDPGSDPRSELKTWLFDKTKDGAASFGARLNWVSFATPKIPREAVKQFEERWRTRIKREEQKSTAATRLELAKAEAETERVKRQPGIEQMEQLIEFLTDHGVPAEAIGEMFAPAFIQDPETSLMLRSMMRGSRGSSS